MRFNMADYKRIVLGRGHDLEMHKGKKEATVEGRVREPSLLQLSLTYGCMRERAAVKLPYKACVWQ